MIMFIENNVCREFVTGPICQFHFYTCVLCDVTHSAVMPQYVVCLSVCPPVYPSVMVSYRDATDWNS